MILIGVTGGMGVGKTTALECFRALGTAVLDADRIVHRLYARGAVGYEAVVFRWGERVLQSDGRVDRAAIARIVFADRRELDWLNGVIHPLVRQCILEHAGRPERKLLCCGVPLLYESGWDAIMEQIISIWCAPAVQRQRLLARGWDDDAIESRRARQMPMDEKLARADFGIDNDGSIEILRIQCERIHGRLCSRFGVSLQ